MPDDHSSRTMDRAAASGELYKLQAPAVHQAVIMVADDEVLIRNLVILLLQQQGYFVLAATDGFEGLEISRQYPGTIDLLITDRKYRA
jgi:CheY-like chemotaxis protein